MTAPAKRLRLDRSRAFGTIRGTRASGDKHQFAHYTQDGIHFDVDGLHIESLIEDDKTRALVDRRLKRVSAPKEDDGKSAGGSDDPDDPSPSGGGSQDSVNLEAWLRGEEKYPWFSITKTMRERYSQNLTKAVDVVDFLVIDQKIVSEKDLAPEFAAMLKPAT